MTTTSGDTVTVLAPGEQHRNSGPDFFNARIRIGDTLWAGNVEIHTLASDWYRHSHHSDEAYSGIILHVVYEADCDIMLSDQRTVPALELKNFIHPGLTESYRMLIRSSDPIPCHDSLHTIPGIIRTSWLDRMLAERLEQKSDLIREALHYCNGNYEHAFFHVLAAGFGFHVNSLPFSMLARVLPLRIIQKHADDPVLVEALIFGQAGFLTTDEPEGRDEYFTLLKMHYDFLAAKYGLMPIEKHLWKFLRMRPVNFPTIRLAQFARVSVAIPDLFAALVAGIAPAELLKRLNVQASDYWSTHYLPGKTAPYREKRLGKESAAVLAINSVAPFLFMYGKWKGEPDQCAKAFDLLHALPAERNHVVDHWGQYPFRPESSYDSQALIELSNQYCVKKKCLNCSIGTHLLREGLSGKTLDKK